MAGTRITFGRVDALEALLELLGTSDLLTDVQISDTWQGTAAKAECIYAGPISGSIDQGPMRSAGRTIDDDEFIIPLHVEATKTAGQKTSMLARKRCEQLMNGIRQTVALAKDFAHGVPGMQYATNDSADGPDAEAVTDPAGWVAYGTVRVRVKIRMQ